jgi:hypothetical protein
VAGCGHGGVGTCRGVTCVLLSGRRSRWRHPPARAAVVRPVSAIAVGALVVLAETVLNLLRWSIDWQQAGPFYLANDRPNERTREGYTPSAPSMAGIRPPNSVPLSGNEVAVPSDANSVSVTG